ncbi:MAG TPA: polysaccharide deacetylase family protein [Magnetospirillaceae bacterium]|jgi:peptidoglycan/xylan/chitin deacetylase (PgdA/CDA1 family)
MSGNPFYQYSAIIDRPPLEWPGGRHLAVYVGLNLEHYAFGEHSVGLLDAVAQRDPDPINFSWRDYGVRVGVWRMAELFERLELKPSVLLNADVCDEYPRIIEEGNKRGWTWIAHGKNNSMFAGDPPHLSKEAESEYLRAVFDTIARATGARPKGWLGPLGLSETYATCSILRELGATYVLDWANDDQPYRLSPSQADLLSIPYSFELNDLPFFVKNGADGTAFARMMVDQFDVLYAESRTIARVMPICIHPFVTGQAFRHKHFAEALAYIAGHRDVWLTTADEIAAYTERNHRAK